jgi:hypothetical protein
MYALFASSRSPADLLGARRLAQGDMAVARLEPFRCCRLLRLAQTLDRQNERFACSAVIKLKYGADQKIR